MSENRITLSYNGEAREMNAGLLTFRGNVLSQPEHDSAAVWLLCLASIF